MPCRHRRPDARARRHRFDHRPRRRGGALAGRLPARPRLHRHGAAGRRHAIQRHRDTVSRHAGGRLLDALRLRAAVLSEPRRRRSSVRPRLVRRERHSRRAGGGRRSTAARRRDARRPACSSSARNAAATAPGRRTKRRRRTAGFLIDGEPTDNRLGVATRGILRLKLRAQRPRRAFVVSRARRVGDRQADRRARRAAIGRAAGGSRCSAGRITRSA